MRPNKHIKSSQSTLPAVRDRGTAMGLSKGECETQPTPISDLTGDTSSLHVIRKPGTYVLTADLIGKAGKRGIRIESDNVIVDLQGRALLGCPGSLDGICVPALAVNVTIRNGTIRGWGGDGADLSNVIGSTTTDLDILDNRGFGLLIGTGASVDGCRVDGNGSRAVAAWSKSGRLLE